MCLCIPLNTILSFQSYYEECALFILSTLTQVLLQQLCLPLQLFRPVLYKCTFLWKKNWNMDNCYVGRTNNLDYYIFWKTWNYTTLLLAQPIRNFLFVFLKIRSINGAGWPGIFLLTGCIVLRHHIAEFLLLF